MVDSRRKQHFDQRCENCDAGGKLGTITGPVCRAPIRNPRDFRTAAIQEAVALRRGARFANLIAASFVTTVMTGAAAENARPHRQLQWVTGRAMPRRHAQNRGRTCLHLVRMLSRLIGYTL
jgi:hypothetical protein